MRLQVKDIGVSYGDKPIIHNLSLEIPDGKITTIIGSNGCGKSTLLKAMTRIIAQDCGQIILDGKEIRKVNTKELAKKLAILPQNPESAHGLLVEELISYGRFPYQQGIGGLSKKDKEVMEWALKVTYTHSLRNQPVDALSGGQRQRVWIALALVQDTDIIFLDEPTTYLDMAHQLEILELLERLNKQEKKTIIMVLHDLNQAARFSDYIIALSKGKLVRMGTAEEVITPEVLAEVFHIDALIRHDPRTNKPMCMTYNLLKGENKNEKMDNSSTYYTYDNVNSL
ncbi:ABC transporter ATP-binding protein [Oceanobacillus senegalensis]|uniref:ABC transporter ATP-binding protein n=1 Tax=Oceanobacillus senegalensis TaxID=1936063 RepID=UPI000A30968C|nr:ABC transporter ATP-binding protein [Oceanobacillus senegalensis]